MKHLNVVILLGGLGVLCLSLLGRAELPDISGIGVTSGGSTVERQSQNGVVYSLYTPAANNTFAGATAIVLLHGAGDNNKNFMTAWTSYPFMPEWIAISINAREGAAWQAGEVDRVLEVLDEVASEYSIRRVFVGGFSRGGGFCYSVALAHPDRFDGILSLAGNVWNPGLIKPAHADKVKVAIVHGGADTVIPPKHGQDAHDRFQKAGYESYLKIIDGWAHTLHGSETQKALEWLDEKAAPLKTPKDYYTYAMASFKEGNFAQAAWALRTIDVEENKGEKFYKKIASTLKKIETKSERSAKKILKSIDQDKNDRWVKSWREYDRRFGGTHQHTTVTEKVEALTEKHQAQAEELYEKAVVAHGLAEIETSIERCLEIRDKCYLATDEPVKEAKELLAGFREDPEISKKYRSLLKGTEAW